MQPIYYMAHPVQADRAANLQRARRWLRYLIDRYPSIAFAVPWMPYCDVLPESYRIRGMRDNVATLVVCNGIVAVGGEITLGMQAELDVARRRGLDIIDLTHLGPEPPE